LEPVLGFTNKMGAWNRVVVLPVAFYFGPRFPLKSFHVRRHVTETIFRAVLSVDTELAVKIAE